jgi:hypothetical protein
MKKKNTKIIITILNAIEKFFCHLKYNWYMYLATIFLGWVAISVFEIGFLERSSDWNAIVLLLEAREALY